ncbi:MAG: hypothetical protein QW482_05935, partial [Thermoproteota archaeon]
MQNRIMITGAGSGLGREIALRWARVGWRVALASNSPLSLCHHTLDALGLRPAFDAIVSAEQVVRGKPAPDIYHF